MAIPCLFVVGALVVGGLTSEVAVAATVGTTAFTCDPNAAVKTFGDAHCTEGGGNAFGHTEFLGETGKITFSGGQTLLHSVISGIEVEIKSTELTGTGTMENALAGTGEHLAKGTATIEFKNATVVKPAGKGCFVEAGEVKTKKLNATTAGQGMGLKIEPAAGAVLAEFEIKGCAIAAIAGLYEVTGSVVGAPEGATTVFTRAGTTAQITLKLRGQKAGISSSITIKGQNGNGLAPTTIETP